MAPLKPARVPAYFDAFLDAVNHGAQIDHVHLGHWDRPDAANGTPEDFDIAQTAMAKKLIDLGDVQAGQQVLDVGCGLGGLARLIDSGFSAIAFTGLNIDVRQLAVCKTIESQRDNYFNWVTADACALPFANTSFDRVFCVEAIFHFESRARFLAEAMRVLKPGGLLILSDILLQRPDASFPLPVETMEACLETELGPWPEKWISPAELRSCIQSGFHPDIEIDASANTLPSYLTIAPDMNARLTGPKVMRMLHESGHLTYLYLRLLKPAAPHI